MLYFCITVLYIVCIRVCYQWVSLWDSVCYSLGLHVTIRDRPPCRGHHPPVRYLYTPADSGGYFHIMVSTLGAVTLVVYTSSTTTSPLRCKQWVVAGNLMWCNRVTPLNDNRRTDPRVL
jgi:hypothetical protein